jgi:hypothetical protein
VEANQQIRITRSAERWARAFEHYQLGDCARCKGKVHPRHFVLDHAERWYMAGANVPRYDRALVREALLAQNIIAPPDLLAENVVRRALLAFIKVHPLPASDVLQGTPSEPTPCA